MEDRGSWVAWLGLVAGVVGAVPGVLRAQDEGPRTIRVGLFWHRDTARQEAAARVPLDEVLPGFRRNVYSVLEKPTLFTHGPAETFTCSPSLYRWLLDHPDQTVRIWRKLGAQCTDINSQGEGAFGWSDGQGSALRWWAVLRTAAMQVWYAEGNAKVASALPLIPVRAVVVLHHQQGKNADGRTVVRHQADMFLHTDSKTAALVARLMGPSAPRMAEQGAGQMEMFFSALAWYFDRHPTRAETVLSGIVPADSPQWREIQQRAGAARSGEAPPKRSPGS
jgi:hypothetical protein